MISSERFSAYFEKVIAVIEWSQPQMIREVKSFHRLATFYYRFIKNFSTVMTPITDFLKNENFQWTSAATEAFEKIKKLFEDPIMCLPDFSMAFEVACGASGLAIGGVLSQENHHVAYCNENLNDTR